MIVRAIDGRYLGHQFPFSIEREWRKRTAMATGVASIQIHTIFMPRFLNPEKSNMKWKRESQTANCFRQQACTHKRVSSSGGLCVGAQRSVCRGPALSVSGRGALCVGPRRSLSLSVSGPDSLSLGARSSLCRGPALSVSGSAPSVSLCRVPALFLWGPALCRAPVSVSAALFVSGPSALVGGSRHRARWERTAPYRTSTVFLCRGQRILCRVPALCAVCQGPLCGSPALFVSGPTLSMSAPLFPGASVEVCIGGARQSTRCVGPRCPSAGPQSSSNPRIQLCGPPAPFPRAQSPDPRATPPAAGPSSDPRATHPTWCVPFFQERTPNRDKSYQPFRRIPYHNLRIRSFDPGSFVACLPAKQATQCWILRHPPGRKSTFPTLTALHLKARSWGNSVCPLLHG